MSIDKDNFDEVIINESEGSFYGQSVIPGNEGKLDVELTFKCKDDFSPDHAIQQVECLKKLSELRSTFVTCVTGLQVMKN
ncbi:type VI secretion system contractile sheath small subunit [Escherichia coli]